VDAVALNMNVDGTIVPVDPAQINQITTIPGRESDASAAAGAAPESADTVMMANPAADEYGMPLPPIAVVGRIVTDDRRGITLRTSAGTERMISRERVVRVIRYSATDFDAPIRRYAKPLFCPESMALVDLPPGADNRPFFKVCVDKYEFPNRAGVVPEGNLSYQDALKLCKGQGKRLCRAEEWQWACSGMEGYTFPYGWQFDKMKCNAQGARQLASSGSHRQCVGKFGLADMTGNIFEWVEGRDGEPMLMGGPYSKCQTVSPGVGGGAKPQTGVRCCMSN
jgi:hypothetical protein